MCAVSCVYNVCCFLRVQCGILFRCFCGCVTLTTYIGYKWGCGLVAELIDCGAGSLAAGEMPYRAVRLMLLLG
jgi:hypothetical protein